MPLEASIRVTAVNPSCVFSDIQHQSAGMLRAGGGAIVPLAR